MTKQQIVDALRAFAEQRPGIEPGNYGSWRDYRNESAQVTRDLHDARELIRAVERRDGITAEALAAAFRSFSGRLSLSEKDGAAVLDYCTGQYFPTEFRRAVCAVCSQALWDHVRDHCMPAPNEFRVVYNGDGGWQDVHKSRAFTTRADAEHYRSTVAAGCNPYVDEYYTGGDTAGDWLRRHFRREFGPRLARRYFD